jgi:ankyrin repeat protein
MIMARLFDEFVESFNKNDLTECERILKDNKDLVNGGKATHKRTFLHIAAAEGEEKVVEYLIKNKFDVNAKDIEGMTPLHLASSFGHQKIVQKLLKSGAKIDIQAKSGFAPSHCAVRYGKYDVLKILLENGADKNLRINNDSGNTLILLLLSLSNISSSIFNLLLNSGVELNCYNTQLETPLYLAVKNKYYYGIEQLLNHGAHVNFILDKNPLYCAVKCRYPAAVKLLLEKGADIYFTDGNNRTPLELAEEKGYSECAELIRQYYPSTSLSLASAQSITRVLGCQIL